MPEEDFESKSHVTKHLTGSRFHLIRERSRINSWEEQDYINWEEFLAMTLSPARLTPLTLKTVADVNKYKSAFRSYKFGVLNQLRGMWLYILIGGIVAVTMILYFMGYIGR